MKAAKYHYLKFKFYFWCLESASVLALILPSLSVSQREVKKNYDTWLYQTTHDVIKSLCCLCRRDMNSETHYPQMQEQQRRKTAVAVSCLAVAL